MALYVNSEYKINQKGLIAAKKICANILNQQSRKRAFKALICLDVLADYLASSGFSIDISKNLYKILPLNEEFEYTDLHYNGNFLDILPVVNEKYVLIPKIHFDYGIVPDLYVVADYDSSSQKVKFIGCIDSSNLDKSRQNHKYFIMDTENLLPPNVIEDRLSIVKQSDIREKNHDIFSSYYIDYLDGILSNDNKKRLITHLIECSVCRAMLVEFFDYESIVKNTAKYPDVFSDLTLDIVGAAAVNDEKYKNFEEITLEIDKEPDEYSEDEEQPAKIIRSVVDDPLQILYGKGKNRQIFDLVNKPAQKKSGMLNDVIKDVSKSIPSTDSLSLTNNEKPDGEDSKTSNSINPKYYEEDLSDGFEIISDFETDISPKNYETTETIDIPEFKQELNPSVSNTMSAEDEMILLEDTVDVDKPLFVTNNDLPSGKQDVEIGKNPYDDLIFEDEEETENISPISLNSISQSDYSTSLIGTTNESIASLDEEMILLDDDSTFAESDKVQDNQEQIEINIPDENENLIIENISDEQNKEVQNSQNIINVEDKEEIVLDEDNIEEISEDDLIHFNAVDVDLIDENDSNYSIIAPVGGQIPNNIEAAGIAGSSLLDYEEENAEFSLEEPFSLSSNKVNKVENEEDIIIIDDEENILEDTVITDKSTNSVKDSDEEGLIVIDDNETPLSEQQDAEDILILDENEELQLEESENVPDNKNIISGEEDIVVIDDEENILEEPVITNKNTNGVKDSDEEDLIVIDDNETLLSEQQDAENILILDENEELQLEEPLNTTDSTNSAAQEVSYDDLLLAEVGETEEENIQNESTDDDKDEDELLFSSDDMFTQINNSDIQKHIPDIENDDDILIIDDEEGSFNSNNISINSEKTEDNDLIIIDDEDDASLTMTDFSSESELSSDINEDKNILNSDISIAEEDMLIIDDEEPSLEENLPEKLNTAENQESEIDDIVNINTQDEELPLSDFSEESFVLESHEDDSSFLQLEEDEDLLLEEETQIEEVHQEPQSVSSEEDDLYYDGDEITGSSPSVISNFEVNTPQKSEETINYDLDFIDEIPHTESDRTKEESIEYNNIPVNQDDEDDELVIIDDDDTSFVRPASVQNNSLHNNSLSSLNDNNDFVRPAGVSYDITGSAMDEDDDLVIINDDDDVSNEPVYNQNVSLNDNLNNDDMDIPEETESETVMNFNQNDYSQNISANQTVADVQYDEDGFEITSPSDKENVVSSNTENIQSLSDEDIEMYNQYQDSENINNQEESETSFENETSEYSDDNEYEEDNSEEEYDDDNFEDEEEEYEEESEEEAAAKKNKIIKIAIGAAALLILAGAGFGAKMLFFNNNQQATIAENQDITNTGADEPLGGIVVPDDNNDAASESKPPVNNDDGGLTIPDDGGLTVPDDGGLSVPENSGNTSNVQSAAPKAGTSNATTEDMNKAVTNAFSDNPTAVSIRKVTWGVNASIAGDTQLRQYLQSTGKNIQDALKNNVKDLKGVTPTQKPKVQIKFTQDGNVQDFIMLKSSGSEEIDSIVLQSVKDIVCAAPPLQLSQESLNANEQASGGKTINLSLSVIF